MPPGGGYDAGRVYVTLGFDLQTAELKRYDEQIKRARKTPAVKTPVKFDYDSAAYHRFMQEYVKAKALPNVHIKIDYDRSAVQSFERDARGLGRALSDIKKDADTGGSGLLGFGASMGGVLKWVALLNPGIQALSLVLVGLVGSLGSAALGAGALSVALGGALAPALALGVGAFLRLSKIMNVYKAQQQEHQALAASGAKASTNEADAQDTLRSALERVQTSRQGLKDATRSYSDAVQQARKDIRQSRDDEVQAAKAVADAQRNLAQARLEASRAQQDAFSGAGDAALAAGDAALALHEAQARGPGTGHDRTVFDAQRQLASATRDSNRAQEDANKFAQEGVKAYGPLRSAIDQLAQAEKDLREKTQTRMKLEQEGVAHNRQVEQALQGQRNARRELADAIRAQAAAQRHLNADSAGGAAGLKADYLLKQLSPVERGLLRTLERVKKGWRDATKTGVDSMLGGLGKGLSRVPGLLDKLKPDFTKLGAALGDQTDAFFKDLTGPQWTDAWKQFTEAAVPVTRDLSKDFRDWMAIFRDIATAALPDLKKSLDGSVSSMDALRKRFDNHEFDDKVHGWITSFRDWWKLIKDVGHLLGTVFGQGKTQGDDMVTSLDKLVRKWTAWLKSNPDKVRHFIKEARDFISQAAKVIGPVAEGFLKVGQFFIKELAKVDPAVLIALGALAKIWAIARFTGAISFLRLLISAYKAARDGRLPMPSLPGRGRGGGGGGGRGRGGGSTGYPTEHPGGGGEGGPHVNVPYIPGRGGGRGEPPIERSPGGVDLPPGYDRTPRRQPRRVRIPGTRRTVRVGRGSGLDAPGGGVGAEAAGGSRAGSVVRGLGRAIAPAIFIYSAATTKGGVGRKIQGGAESLDPVSFFTGGQLRPIHTLTQFLGGDVHNAIFGGPDPNQMTPKEAQRWAREQQKLGKQRAGHQFQGRLPDLSHLPHGLNPLDAFFGRPDAFGTKNPGASDIIAAYLQQAAGKAAKVEIDVSDAIKKHGSLQGAIKATTDKMTALDREEQMARKAGTLDPAAEKSFDVRRQHLRDLLGTYQDYQQGVGTVVRQVNTQWDRLSSHTDANAKDMQSTVERNAQKIADSLGTHSKGGAAALNSNFQDAVHWVKTHMSDANGLTDKGTATMKWLMDHRSQLGANAVNTNLSQIGPDIHNAFHNSGGILDWITNGINDVWNALKRFFGSSSKQRGKTAKEAGSFLGQLLSSVSGGALSSGGFISGPGGGRDEILAFVADDEAVLNHPQQAEVNDALEETGRGSLRDLFKRTQHSRHHMANRAGTVARAASGMLPSFAGGKPPKAQHPKATMAKHKPKPKPKKPKKPTVASQVSGIMKTVYAPVGASGDLSQYLGQPDSPPAVYQTILDAITSDQGKIEVKQAEFNNISDDQFPLLDPKTGAVNTANITKRTDKLGEIKTLQQDIEAQLNNAIAVIKGIIAAYNTMISRLKDAIKNATGNVKTTLSGTLATLSDDLPTWTKELANITNLTLPLAQQDTISTQNQIDSLNGTSSSSGSGTTSPVEDAAAQLTAFTQNRADLFGSFGANFARVGANPFADATSQAAGMRFFGATGAGGGSGGFGAAGALDASGGGASLGGSSAGGVSGLAVGGGDKPPVQIINNFQEPPPDPHTWSKGVEFELSAT